MPYTASAPALLVAVRSSPPVAAFRPEARVAPLLALCWAAYYNMIIRGAIASTVLSVFSKQYFMVRLYPETLRIVLSSVLSRPALTRADITPAQTADERIAADRREQACRHVYDDPRVE